MPTRNPHDGIHLKQLISLKESKSAIREAKRLQRKGLSLSKIAAQLGELGYKNARTHRPFNITTVFHLLKDA